MRLLFLTVFMLVLAACSSKPTVSEYQCAAGDWQTIGYRDGTAGFDSTRLLAHQEACGAFGIVPNRAQYLTGWNEGLAAFCTGGNGFALGKRGSGHNGVCRGELAEPFSGAYADGRELYQARHEVNRLSAQLAAGEARLAQIKQEMIGATTAQLTPDLSTEERLRLLARLETLAEERGEIMAAAPGLEQDLAASEDRLERLNRSLASVSY